MGQTAAANRLLTLKIIDESLDSDNQMFLSKETIRISMMIINRMGMETPHAPALDGAFDLKRFKSLFDFSNRLLKLTTDYRLFAIASSKISNATSTFSRVMMRGGDQRMVLTPQPRRMRPRS